MPGLVQDRRKRPSIAISDDDEEEEQSGFGSSVSTSSKRARLGPDASNGPRNSNHVRQNIHTMGISVEDSFPPGSLVRVKLKNFVTYTNAEFHLGPSLNMVIGPNGTGKSTLVCAICLGLGWSSEHLGRAKETGLFVKNGSTEAEIEIELAAGPGMKKNPVVRRSIRKEDNKSIFWIDGKHTTKNAVLALCKKFSIQIDNLCQFLPQDRVVEFARMTDVDRLRETQRAAAPAHMVEWHDQLKGLRTEEKDHETKQRNEQEHLSKLEKQQARDQDDVDRFQQREGLVRKLKCLTNVRPVIELNLRRKEFDQAKNDLSAMRHELVQIKADVEPARQAQVETDTYRDQVDEVVKLRKNRVDMMRTKADKLIASIENHKQSATSFTAEISGELSSKKERERDIARITAEIQRLERQRQEEPVAFDAESFDRTKAELRTQMSAASNRLTERESVFDEIRNRVHGIGQEYNKAKGKRAQLETQGGKQASILATVSPDTAQAWAWVQNNKDSLSLKGEVFGPPILECSILEPRFADAVETQMKKGDFLAITCTNADDQRQLADKLLGKKAVGSLEFHDIFLRTSPRALSEYRSPVSSSDLTRFGFEGYLIDYIKGPDPVLAMLCDNARLNSTAYASKPITDEQYNEVSSSRIQKWISGREVYQITTRREYGVSSTGVIQLRPARYFVDQPANTEEMRSLDDKIKLLQREGTELKEEISGCKEEIADLKQQIHQIREDRDRLQAEQDRVKKAIAEWNALPTKIQMKQDKLQELNEANTQTSDRIRTIKTNARQISLKVAALTLDYAKAVTQLRSFHEALVEAEIRLIEAKSESNALENENRDLLENLRQKEADIQALHQRKEALKREWMRMAKTVQQDLDVMEEEEKEMVQEYSQLPTFEALEQEVAAVNARLEMMAEGNSGILRAYHKRADDIVKTREKLEEYTASLESTKETIAGIRAQWEPELDALISKISDAFAHNFQQIGCAGEVSVYKDEEDFDNWSIQISVRFREAETLSVLNSHRQSGGERAVSTIFYLMALQDLAQSPFRVVDEINQGMDPRNERMVHERMVDIACQERTSQYFLITPKLLTGLKFHPKMKVHIINSGEHVPDAKEAKTWDMRAMAKIALRRKGIEVS